MENIILILLLVGLGFSLLILVRNNLVCAESCKYLHAIYSYIMDCLMRDIKPEFEYEILRDYNEILFDWPHIFDLTNIRVIDNPKYVEILKPYIED